MNGSCRWSLILTIHLVLATSLHAQYPRLWGMCASGGATNQGTMFRVDADGTDYTVEFDFDDSSGYAPEGSLCLAPNGKLYGMTNLGGSGSPAGGTVFSFDPSGGVFEKLVDFNLSNGGFGWGGMIVGADGKLYGASYGGGSGGSIFSVDPATDNYTILHALTEADDGSAINNKLSQAPDGKLYGLCSQGGADDAGTIFSYDITTDVFINLHDFDGSGNGRTPYGQPCLADNGWIYGTTFDGGVNSQGILWKYDPVSDAFVKLLDFDGDNGQTPWNAPIRVAPDLLMGTVTWGGSNAGGLIYSLVPSTDQFTEVYSFSPVDGGLLFGNVVVGSDGQLYGVGNSGGTNFFGTVYRFNPAAAAMTNLYSFNTGASGLSARGDLVQAGVVSAVPDKDDALMFTAIHDAAQHELVIRCSQPFSGTLLIHDQLGRELKRLRIDRMLTSIPFDPPTGIYAIVLATGNEQRTRRVMVY